MCNFANYNLCNHTACDSALSSSNSFIITHCILFTIYIAACAAYLIAVKTMPSSMASIAAINTAEFRDVQQNLQATANTSKDDGRYVINVMGHGSVVQLEDKEAIDDHVSRVMWLGILVYVLFIAWIHTIAFAELGDPSRCMGWCADSKVPWLTYMIQYFV